MPQLVLEKFYSMCKLFPNATITITWDKDGKIVKQTIEEWV